jgi:hypothetical protein
MAEEKNQQPDKSDNPLAQKVAGIDEQRWLQYQNIGGAALGLVAGALMFFVKDEGSFLPLNFVLALVVAKFLPDYLEKQTGRSLRRARITMVIVMAAAILAYAGYILLTKGPSAFSAKA